jgi:hypothetical protein
VYDKEQGDQSRRAVNPTCAFLDAIVTNAELGDIAVPLRFREQFRPQAADGLRRATHGTPRRRDASPWSGDLKNGLAFAKDMKRDDLLNKPRAERHIQPGEREALRLRTVHAELSAGEQLRAAQGRSTHGPAGTSAAMVGEKKCSGKTSETAARQLRHAFEYKVTRLSLFVVRMLVAVLAITTLFGPSVGPVVAASATRLGQDCIDASMADGDTLACDMAGDAATGAMPADAIPTGDMPADAEANADTPADATPGSEIPADAASTGDMPTEQAQPQAAPLPSAQPMGIAGAWTNVTGNLANMPSECGNLTMLSSVPGSDEIIAGVAVKGLWQAKDGSSWTNLGTGPDSAVIKNRPNWIVYDPKNPQTFWESGIYNGGGTYKTNDGGATFVQLGSVTHNDFIAVDFNDPDRKLLLAGGHEQPRTLWKSTDGGQAWTNIGQNLPKGTGPSTSPVIIDSQTYLVNSDQRARPELPGIYRTTDGGATWDRVSTIGPWGEALVASNGTIYWSVEDHLVESTDHGQTWSIVGGGLANLVMPIELPGGRIASLTPKNIVVSTDGGVTWSHFGPTLPYVPAGLVYSAAQQAFYIWHWDCGVNVLPDAIEKLSLDVGGG